MSKTRLSLEMDEEEHKYLKMCCAKIGVSIKEFVLKATIDTVDSWEDKWMLERWEKDGTREELERERNDPNCVTYSMENINGKFFCTEMKGNKIIGAPFEI